MAVPAAIGIVPPLLVALADGATHSGESLARRLGVTRAAVWKGIRRLRAQDIGVEALPRRGYRLAGPVELLDAARIQAVLGPRAALLHDCELSFEVTSTNTRLLQRTPPPFGRADVCLCELQTAGRGRRGRGWIAPFGGGIALSLAWSFREAARDLPALSLAVGVAVVRALARCGARDVGLKWPNDVWWQRRKLGGILIELRAEAGGPAFVVIGIGLNVTLPPEARRAIEATGTVPAAAADASGSVPSRNALVGAILDELLSMLAQFEAAGFAPFRSQFAALDALQGAPVRVLIGNGTITGLARGVDADGALLVEVDGGLQRFVSGEVSLRLEGGVK